jgi:7-cyano-7-deazaguanine synthase
MTLGSVEPRGGPPPLLAVDGLRKVFVLLSGGVDSAACVAFYLAQSSAVDAVFVDYGQSAAADEAKASRAVATHFKIPLHSVQLHGVRRKSEGLIYGRNAFLYLLALLEFADVASLITTGIHSGTDYWDCSPGFLSGVQRLFDQYTDGRVQATAPFVLWNKRQVWDLCLDRGVPLDLTYSCERGGVPACGQCLSCRDIQALRARA